MAEILAAICLGQQEVTPFSFFHESRDTSRELGGGTLYDIGIYCINAARYLFRSEPTEVMALSVNSGVKKLKEIDESTGALLRFDHDRVAAFVTSFNSADVGAYRIVGTKGSCMSIPRTSTRRGSPTS